MTVLLNYQKLLNQFLKILKKNNKLKSGNRPENFIYMAEIFGEDSLYY